MRSVSVRSRGYLADVAGGSSSRKSGGDDGMGDKCRFGKGDETGGVGSCGGVDATNGGICGSGNTGDGCPIPYGALLVCPLLPFRACLGPSL